MYFTHLEVMDRQGVWAGGPRPTSPLMDIPHAGGGVGSGGGRRQVALVPTSPRLSLEGAAPARVPGGGLGPRSLGVPSPVAVMAQGASPALSMMQSSSSAGLAQLSPVGGRAGGLTPNGVTRDDIIAFGGISDPVSNGRRMSCRL